MPITIATDLRLYVLSIWPSDAAAGAALCRVVARAHARGERPPADTGDAHWLWYLRQIAAQA